MKILVTGKTTPRGLEVLKSVRGAQVQYSVGLQGEALIDAVREISGLLIRTETRVTKSLLSEAKNLKVVCRAGVGVDNIDLKTCHEKGVVVMNTPAANKVAAAEMTLGLLVSLARYIPKADRLLKLGEWPRDQLTGSELIGKTLGLVGFGNIGKLVAKRAKAFEMVVIAHDPYIPVKDAQDLDVELTSREELLHKSDFVSLHVPLTLETKRMADADFFKKMKKGSSFLNTSRGAVCSEEDLLKVLREKHLKSAALDVFEKEPLPADSPLLSQESLILTPHTAGQTFESQERMSVEAATQMKVFLETGQVKKEALCLP